MLLTDQPSNITSILALTPYASPKYNEMGTVRIRPEESFQSLLSNDHGNDIIRNNYLNSLDSNLRFMYEFQTKEIFPPENTNLHQDLLPQFLHYICEPSKPLFSLVSVPSLTSIEFPDLFYSNIFSLHIPPHRASWLIHNYLYQTGMTRDSLTEYLKTLQRINPKDHDYFTKLVYCLCSNNLVNQLKIIEWLIQTFRPEHLEIFKNEIFNSYKLLNISLNSKFYMKYAEMLSDLLITRPPQTVQLAISQVYSPYENSKRLRNDVFRLIEMNDSMKMRASVILKAIKSNSISLFIKTYLMMCLNFPYYDIPQIIEEFRLFFQFISVREKEKYVFDLISLIKDFSNEPETISAVFIELIKIMNIKFPLKGFVEFLYEKVDSIENYTYFFYELQYHKIFEYLDFLSIISNTGKSVEFYDSTFKILLNLPPIEYTQIIRGKVKQILLKNSEVYFEIEQIFKKCQLDIENNYDIANTLPPYFLYMLGYLIINNKEIEFLTKSQILAQLNLEPLIFSIFPDEKQPIFSVFALIQIKHFIPLLYSRKILNKFISIITNEKEALRYFDICLFLNESYSLSSYLKDCKDKIQIICNKKVEYIDPEKISELAYDYSHLFNVFILNDFYCIRTINEFKKLFFIFLKNLLNFEALCIEYLLEFFISFTESICISFPLQFFINIFLLVILFGVKMNDKIKATITKFFYFLIQKKFYSGSEYLNAIYKIVVSRRIDINDCENANHLFDVLSSIVEKNPKMFTFSSLIQISVANWLTIRNRHLRDIIRPLSSNSIIITQSMINMLHAPPSNYGAVFFYLLPRELYEYETNDTFDFYFQNVAHNTMLLWTIWLKNRPLYKIEKVTYETIIQNQKVEKTELIVIPNYLLNEYSENYRIQISNYFINITSNSENRDSIMMDIYLESFRLLCDHQRIAKITYDLIINELNSNSLKLSFDSIRLTFYLFSYLNEKQIETLCNVLLSFDLDLIFEDDSFIFKSGYFFLICFAKFARQSNSKVLMTTANKILQLIPEIYENQYKSSQFLVDCFNFYIAITSNKDIQFHNEFMEAIKENWLKLKGKLKKEIILNQTPMFYSEITEPLYIKTQNHSTSLEADLYSGSNQINDIFVDDGDDWYQI